MQVIKYKVKYLSTVTFPYGASQGASYRVYNPVKHMNETTQDNLNTSQSINSEIADIIQAVEITSDVLNDTRKDVQAIKSSMLSKKDITKLKPNDGKNGKDGLNGKDGRDGLDGADGLDGSPDTPAQVRDKLSSLKGDKRLDKSAIKGLEDIIGQTDLDRAVSILDSRTSFLINKINNLGNTGGGGGSGPFSGITGTPTEIAYFDLSGNGYSDALATRNPITNETYIGYRTSGGDFSNGFHLGNILGGALSDGAAFQRHDAVNDNFTFIGTVDVTPFGGSTNALLGGYADLVNGITSVFTLDEVGTDLTYKNNILKIYGAFGTNDSNSFIKHTDYATYQAQLYLQSDKIQARFEDITTGRIMKDIVDGTSVRAGDFGSTGNKMSYTLDDENRFFQVFGLYNSLTNSYGSMLNLDAQNETMEMGDVTNISSKVKIGVDNSNATAYIDGLAKTVVNWTPSTLSDGFTGTGLNDMHYDSTITYKGTYPNTYTATIASVNSVYMQLTSITTPGFTVGDTVTDGASTGTIIAGGDGDGFIIIQPIVDTGWTSATSITDISSGAASTVGSVAYTDTMSWSSTAGGSGTLIPTSSFIDLGDGLTVKFTSPTGHTIGDSWTWEVTANYTYSKMALFDGVNRTMSIGDVEQAANDARTDWVLGTGKNAGIYEYLGITSNYNVVHDQGPLLKLQFDAGYLNFGIENPASSINVFHVSGDSTGYGAGIGIFDSDGDGHSVFIGDRFNAKNSTLISVSDSLSTIKFTADGLETDSQDIPITVKVVLTQTELSTFGTVPIEVVPAPGAGKAIQPISAYAEYEYGGTAYANFGIPGLTHNPSSGSLPLKTTVSLLDQTVNYVRFFKPTDEGYNAGFTIDNQPLYFTDDDGSDPTAGNGTLTLYVTYKIIKL